MFKNLRNKATKQKFKNKITIFDGIKFHSKVEMKRYVQLKSMEKDGLITNLTLQPKFKFSLPDGTPILYVHSKTKKQLTYIADFSYIRLDDQKIVVEDVKSPVTAKLREFKIKIALMYALHGILVDIIY